MVGDGSLRERCEAQARELVDQAVAQGLSLAVHAEGNEAIDELLERLARHEALAPVHRRLEQTRKALRELFAGYRFRAQQNTRYMESDTQEATVTHVLDTLLSRLTSADIQSTITPDEGRNIPWHHNNVAGVNAARQTLMGTDGLKDLVELKNDGVVTKDAREIKERAVLFLEEILADAVLEKEEIRLGHPGGVIPVGVEMAKNRNTYHYKKALVYRTARRLMDGHVYVPQHHFIQKG